MGQEENNTHYLERSLDELRQDINVKAEELFIKLSKTSKICWAILILALVVFEVLNLHYKWIEQNWWSFGASLCALALALFIIYTINKRLFSAMVRATDAAQHLKATKRLILAYKWGTVFGYTFGILFCAFCFRGKIIIEDLYLLSAGFIGSAIGAFFPNRTYSNRKLRDFYDDVDELSMYVD